MTMSRGRRRRRRRRNSAEIRIRGREVKLFDWAIMRTILGKCQPLLIKCLVLVHNIREAGAV